MAKLLSVVRAYQNHGNKISQLAKRFVTTLVDPPPPELKLPTHTFSAANFNFDNSKTKTRLINPIPLIGLITGLLSTGNPCVDLFFSVIKPEKASPAEVEATCIYLKQLLPLAWSRNPLTTLKLICNLRDEMFYMEAFNTAAHWLHHNHPKTLMCNIPSIAVSFGCFIDPVEILYFLLQGRERRRGEEEEDDATLAELTKMAIERYERDPNYKLLHDRVTDVYVEHLKSDMEILKRSFKQSDIDDDERYSLAFEMTDAADCCLSSNSMDAKTINATLICESIARKFFPRESYPEYQGIDDAQYAEKIENRLRKEVLDPLDKASRCGRPKKQGKLCEVETYLEEVKADKSKIEPGALLPPQIMAFADHPNVGEVAELQWKTMVENMKKQGKMKNCLAVCDNCIKFIRGKATEVSLALGLLVSELTQEPWNGKVVSWHSTLQTIQGHDLKSKSKSKFVTMMDFEVTGEDELVIEKAFDSILELAVNENLRPEQMVKKVFVFSKQEFSHEAYSLWEDDYNEIKRKFEAKGYGDAVPHIVIWFMSDDCFDSEPEKIGMPWTQRGMTMLSGFSENLLKLLLENEGEIGPEHVMEAAISEEKYQKLAVVD
ncbi:uncharacterized protein LOC126599137 [Malus sylvestris]|uniref:uncharacterized protein LOC126599137 n=1 Tax=Malus sylvestris TaxID=3752 RepID=UPI0021ACB39D|nr:uncharacterized protein LOC126599137 [Malus sylvestris]